MLLLFSNFDSFHAQVFLNLFRISFCLGDKVKPELGGKEIPPVTLRLPSAYAYLVLSGIWPYFVVPSFAEGESTFKTKWQRLRRLHIPEPPPILLNFDCRSGWNPEQAQLVADALRDHAAANLNVSDERERLIELHRSLPYLQKYTDEHTHENLMGLTIMMGSVDATSA